MNDIYGAIFLLGISSLFFGIFAWLRWGTRSWYETEGRFIDRARAFRSKHNYPLVEFTDKNGQVKQAETNRVAVYFSEPLKLRISPKGTVHTKGSEVWALIPAVPMFILSLSILFAS